MEEGLKDFGFTEKEAKIYTATLKEGISTTYSISIETGIKRSTIYDILQSLIKKGFISSFLKDKKHYYEATDPEFFLTTLIEKQNRIRNTIKKLKRLRQEPIEKPNVEMFVGKEGVKTIFEKSLIVGKPILFYGKLDFFAKLKYYFPQHVMQRIEKKIPIKVLVAKNKLSLKLKKTEKQDYRELKFSKIPFETSTMVFGNCIAYINLEERDMFGILICNKKLANTRRQIFDILWKSGYD